MTNEQILSDVKAMLRITDAEQDPRLLILISHAKIYSNNFCGGDVPGELICRMVCEDYPRLGAQGISYKSFSNMHESYRSDYSDETLRALRGCRHLKVL